MNNKKFWDELKLKRALEKREKKPKTVNKESPAFYKLKTGALNAANLKRKTKL